MFRLLCSLLLIAIKVNAAPIDVQLAQKFTDNINIHDYFVSEKYDGIRAYWDGAQLYSRGKNVINAPKWFTESLPHQPLDGELWVARGAFQLVSQIVLDKTPSPKWQQVKYMVFDAPSIDAPFVNRYQWLRANLEKMPKHIVVIEQFSLTGQAQLQQLLKQYVEQGAEGLMLKRKQSQYRSGRSLDLIKVKLWQEAEGIVIGYHDGKGKYEGMVGSLVVKMANGDTFRLGSGLSQQDRVSPPSIGSVVTYKYQELTQSGKPRFASYLRVRPKE